ncbi:MAG: hypothetical protein OXU68_15460 [Bacteroidota bacterium]|nr:hypothetical protein [Bacteroidota bacterium]
MRYFQVRQAESARSQLDHQDFGRIMSICRSQVAGGEFGAVSVFDRPAVPAVVVDLPGGAAICAGASAGLTEHPL